MLIGGSVALNHCLGKIREPRDLDYIVTEDEWLFYKDHMKRTAQKVERNGHKGHILTDKGIHLEFEIAQEGSSADRLLKLIPNSFGIGSFIPLDGLYMLKMSHRYKKNSPHFLKTMSDIWLMRRYGASISEDYQEMLKLREKETYNYSHPKLNVTKGEFFSGDGINYIYDHDSLHEVVAFLEKPAYTYYISEGEEVKASMEKFFKQSETIKLLGVLEESIVLAAERSQIPNNFSVAPRKSFNIALEKVCTSITSGKFREFAWENYNIVQSLYDKLGGDNWVEKVKNAIEDDKIKPYEG